MYKCLGCDKSNPWDGKGAFAYTCPCGAAIFYEEDTQALALPFSLIRSLQAGTALPHLNDLVGESSHTSPFKEQIVSDLRSKGFIRMEECEQCKNDGTLKRKQDREAYLATLEAESILRRHNQC